MLGKGLRTRGAEKPSISRHFSLLVWVRNAQLGLQPLAPFSSSPVPVYLSPGSRTHVCAHWLPLQLLPFLFWVSLIRVTISDQVLLVKAKALWKQESLKAIPRTHHS